MNVIALAHAAAAAALVVLALGSTDAWAQARTPTHVACVGDSITYGYLASSTSKSLSADLQGLFGSGAAGEGLRTQQRDDAVGR